jgi:hypothetical protein
MGIKLWSLRDVLLGTVSVLVFASALILAAAFTAAWLDERFLEFFIFVDRSER